MSNLSKRASLLKPFCLPFVPFVCWSACVYTCDCLRFSSSYLYLQISIYLSVLVIAAFLAFSFPVSLRANITCAVVVFVSHCTCIFACRLYVDHLISPLAFCALTSIPSLPLLLSLMGDLAVLGWHLAYSLFSCHGYTGLWIAPLLLWPCCGCYRCLNYWTTDLLNTRHTNIFKHDGRSTDPDECWQ